MTVERLLPVIFSCFLGCTLPQQAIQMPECTPAAAPCIPSKYTGTAIDTSVLYPGGIHYRLTELEPPFNSSHNDNALTFIDNIYIISTNRSSQSSTHLLPQHLTCIDKNNKEFNINFERQFDIVGTPCFSRNEQKVYFAANANNGISGDIDLYVGTYSRAEQITITNIAPLEKINRQYSFESQPVLSPDGLKLYFVSDRPGGSGGTDIWVASRASLTSEWGFPDPLPPPVNTPCDELFPSFSIDGKVLYFASNGHPGIGGYDIFAAEHSSGKFTNVTNVQEPVNSRFDEIAPYQKDDTSFYFVSSRPARSMQLNIYTFIKELRSSERPRSETSPEIALFPHRHVRSSTDFSSLEVRGTVRNARDTTTVPNNATVFWRDAHSSVELGRKPTDTSGSFSFTVPSGKEYDVGAESQDKFYDVQRIDARQPKDSVITLSPLLIPDTLLLRINFPFNDDSNPYEYAIADDGTTLPQTWKTLLDLLKISIDASSKQLEHILIIGHTDYFGSDEFNINLARRRAQFVAYELIKRGVPKNLLKIVSAGERQLLPLREGEDDERYRMRLRRVEFIKVFRNK